ncbi:MAG: MBL fold metallo-hydrolase [Parvibaculum sp.]|uniref:MBL fold metallo-hydrolase n=1 Tax=Parvibaculum sp. TaxID=2024848 RepID=UPI002AB94CF1|nr:MBL fold metallo-hydrolase [Parvibaculum sp.]MDZ4380819.1 MBL fold metallo-hydrolase [Parvibaculum sp.]
MNPEVKAFFDETTSTVTYVVADPETRHAAIIDGVADYDPVTGALSHKSADKVVDFVQAEGLMIDWVLDTHAHADHLTATPYLQQKLGGKTGIGERISDIQSHWRNVFDMPYVAADGTPYDRLFRDGDTFPIGNLDARVIHTPGHTGADVTYVIGNAAFIGDTLFMPDYGTARTDFPGGNAHTLYASIRKILSLPGETRVFVGHDYLPESRKDYRWESTVEEQRSSNRHVHEGVSEEDFVKLREERNAKLGTPRLLYPSLQVNIRGGHLPDPEGNGAIYMKTPVKQAG